VVASGDASTATISGLPVGTTTVTVCGADQFGSQLCQSSDVTVTSPPADFKPDAALSSINVGQMQATGDPTVLGAGAAALTSLAGAMDGAGSSKAAQQVVSAKATELVGALSTASADLLYDPAGMKQVSWRAACVCHSSHQCCFDPH
jgi:hypothetical protein